MVYFIVFVLAVFLSKLVLGSPVPLPENTLAQTANPDPLPQTTLAQTDDPVFVGAGDIADCKRTQDEATAQLLDSITGTVFTLGDDAYPDGTLTQFNNCYDPTWPTQDRNRLRREQRLPYPARPRLLQLLWGGGLDTGTTDQRMQGLLLHTGRWHYRPKQRDRSTLARPRSGAGDLPRIRKSVHWLMAHAALSSGNMQTLQCHRFGRLSTIMKPMWC